MIVSRFYRLLYHLSAFLFYFIFCAPIVSWIVGIYLFLAVNFLGVHWTEAFSSLRLDSYKNFLRFHVTKNGSLKCYVIGIESVTRRWKLDVKWTGNGKAVKNDEKLEILNHLNLYNRNSNNIKLKDDLKNLRDKRGIGPSYTWKYPSKWHPHNAKEYQKNLKKSKFYKSRRKSKAKNSRNDKLSVDDTDCRRVNVIDSFVLN